MTGLFSFTVSGLPNPVTAPVGGCAGLITNLPVGQVTVSEVPQSGFELTGIRTSPHDRLVGAHLPGGQATVNIVAGGASDQTIVFFKNRPTGLGRIRICKAAEGPGVTGTYRFTVQTLPGFADIAVGTCSDAFPIEPDVVRVTEAPGRASTSTTWPSTAPS